MKRKIDAFLQAWFDDTDKKPLLVKGCRQVGKTESISGHYYTEQMYN
jgi:hypothetical protein